MRLLLLRILSDVWCTTRLCLGTQSFESVFIFCMNDLGQVSNWCDNSHIVIKPMKTKSTTIATRQKHQLSPLPLDLILRGATVDHGSEHRLLSITIDNKLRWDSHTNNVCKTVSRRVFFLSKLRHIVDIDTRKLFFKS